MKAKNIWWDGFGRGYLGGGYLLHVVFPFRYEHDKHFEKRIYFNDESILSGKIFVYQHHLLLNSGRKATQQFKTLKFSIRDQKNNKSVDCVYIEASVSFR